MRDKTPLDTVRCPLCGRSNHCIMAQRSADRNQPCWCRSETVPQGLIDRLPQEARHRACICQACVKAYHQSAQEQQ